MRLLTLRQLRDRGIPYHRSHLYRLEAAGQFPKRVPLSRARVAWVEEEIDTWLAARVAARNAAAEHGRVQASPS